MGCLGPSLQQGDPTNKRGKAAVAAADVLWARDVAGRARAPGQQ